MSRSAFRVVSERFLVTSRLGYSSFFGRDN